MNTINLTIWKNLKLILAAPVNNSFFYLLILLFTAPVAFIFYEMKDIWNVINFTIVIPYTLTAGRQLLNHLNAAYENSVKSINDKAFSKIIINDYKVVKFLNHQSVIYLLVIIAFIAQLNYIIIDLGILNHDSIFLKWNKIYTPEFEPSYFTKGIFIIYYISIQFILLLFSLIAIVGLIQYSSIIFNTFKKNRQFLKNNVPKPPYFGLDDFNEIAPDFVKLIIIIVLNSITYLINMRASIEYNLIGFWILITAVFFTLFRIKDVLDDYLKSEKNRIKLDFQNQVNKTSEQEMHFSNTLMNVKIEIFSLKSQIITYTGLILTIISIIIVFFVPSWIVAVRNFFESDIIPWL